MEALQLLSFGDTGWGDEIAFGVFITVVLSVCTLPIGLFIGFIIALAKQSKERTLVLSADIYTTIFRGLPELLTIFMVYFGLQIGVRAVSQYFGFENEFEINAFVAGLIALSLVFSSYVSEVFLSAFKVIPVGQYEGAHALGISKTKTMSKIILPQLIKIALPGLANLWMILLKDTALISVIGLSDIMRQTGIAARVTKEPFLFYGISCLLFLCLALLSSIVISRIEVASKKSEVVS